jgi:CheY-like chemotaxis protein
MQNMVKVVMIDDEEEICNLTKMILEKTGRYEVKTAVKATQGIDLVKTLKPDLVLLDVLMPEMDGAEVTERLIEDDSTKTIPIVYLTGLAIPMVFLTALVENEDLKDHAGQFGGHYFIQKPVAAAELVDRLDAIIKEKGLA